MDKDLFPKKAISHKELKDFLIKAKKDTTSINKFEDNELKEKEEFDDLIQKWTESSQKILLMINKGNKVLTKNKNTKSLMAFGAMGAHINMALQALKATESDQ